MTFPLSIQPHPDANGISPRSAPRVWCARGGDRESTHQSLQLSQFFLHLFFPCIYDALARCRRMACEQAAALLAISRCASEGVKEEEGTVRRERLKASPEARKQNQVIRTARCLASSWNTKAALFPWAGVSVSLCRKTTKWNQMLFQRSFVQSEHNLWHRSKRFEDNRPGLELQYDEPDVF